MILKESPTVTFIGAGNLATQLALCLHKSGIKIIQVFSRTEEAASLLAMKVGALSCTHIPDITSEADVYIFALKDTVLEDVASKTPVNKGLWIHTSGSMPMNLFAPYKESYGVLYPLQTFSKTKEVDFSQIPLFLEGSNEKVMDTIKKLANILSPHIYFVDSEKRKRLHLSAVFACNFANHLYSIADEIIRETGIPFSVLFPLIQETAAKVQELPPLDAQTGPAVRYDQNIINKQIEMLKDSPEFQEIYRLLSQSIFHLQKK
ncbi:MAG: DUF2520 domain-containing protein [Bacteroidales bacterium]|nr:DUF2520 domain-containing protein [Bacteroidales bacterium]